MKKFIAALLPAVLIVLMFSSCSKKTNVSVNDVPVSAGIYNYYLDTQKKASPDLTEEEIKNAALNDVSMYVAVNSQFTENNLSLTLSDKSDISQNVNNYWHLFSAYYTGISVSKQDLQKIEENKKYKDALMVNYYSVNGKEPIDDEMLKTYFSENYVAFKSITGFLTTVNADGEAVSLSENEKNHLILSFSQYAGAINDGANIDEVGAALENININSDTVVINRNDTAYPSGFFDKVFALATGKAGSFAIEDYVFVVQRDSLTDNDLNLFSTYRTSCLKSLKGAEFDKILNETCKAYSAMVK